MPAACNAVTVNAGHTVTVDVTDAQASTFTVKGTMSFSRAANSRFTVVLGSMTVNAGGTLDMGNQASPIPQGTTAQLVLAFDTASQLYGLQINNGGNFLVYGAAKTPWTTLAGNNVGPGTTGVPFNVTDATGWQTGDQITVGTETVTIAGLSGNQVTSITGTFGQILQHRHPARGQPDAQCGRAILRHHHRDQRLDSQPGAEHHQLQPDLRRVRLAGAKRFESVTRHLL